MPEAQAKANNASSRGGNKQGAFKDKDKPTEIRMSNITAAKGEEGILEKTFPSRLVSQISGMTNNALFCSCSRCNTNKSWTKRDGQNGW